MAVLNPPNPTAQSDGIALAWGSCSASSGREPPRRLGWLGGGGGHPQLPLSHLATTGEPRSDRSPDQFRERDFVLEGDALERLVELFVERDRGDHHAFPAFGSLLSHDSMILQYCNTVHGW